MTNTETNNLIKEEWCMSMKMIAYFQLQQYGKVFLDEEGQPIVDRNRLAEKVKEELVTRR